MDIETALARYPGAQTFVFGDNPELTSSLLSLVRRGLKRATCGKYDDFASAVEPMPQIGRTDISLNWDRTPALAIRTVELRLLRFDEVDEAFALDEGENDSLAGWRADHRIYFERNSGFDPAMLVVCERFQLVEDFSAG